MTPAELEAAELQGWQAHAAGRPIADCPWPPGDPAGHRWRADWITCEVRRREQAGTMRADTDAARAIAQADVDAQYPPGAAGVVALMREVDEATADSHDVTITWGSERKLDALVTCVWLGEHPEAPHVGIPDEVLADSRYNGWGVTSIRRRTG